MNDSISLVVGPEAIAGYKRLPYKQWYALAEFIDNTTQSYFDTQNTLDPILKSENEPLTITVIIFPYLNLSKPFWIKFHF